jgi:hypothetical protein
MSVLRRAVPEFEPVDRPIATSKTVLVPGDLGGTPAIAKHTVDTADIWRDNLDRESRALAALDGGIPIVQAPRLLRYLPAELLLIMERVEGEPLALQRYAEGTLPPPVLRDLVHQLNALAAIDTPSGLPSVDYVARIERYQATYKILTPDDSKRMLRLASELGPPRSFGHGDLLPSNCLVSADCIKSRVRIIDWEFAGTYLPCYTTRCYGSPSVPTRLPAISSSEMFLVRASSPALGSIA